MVSFMKNIFFFILTIFFTSPIFGQKIYLSTYNDIWRFDPEDCSLKFVIYCVRPLFDISFHPDGTLYGTSGDRLYSININNGNTTLIHSFTDVGITALTTSADGTMYVMGTSGDIWTYDITTDMATNLGATGYYASGDLTFYKGELYVAANGSRIVKINLEDPSLSFVVIEEIDDRHIFGIVSDFVDCNEINCYATTNDSSEVYKINFENQTMELVCKLHITVTGGASTAEFLSSVPIGVGNPSIINPDCNTNNGEISIPAGSGYGQLEYAINANQFQLENSFTQLSAGSYTVYIRDEIGCVDSAYVILTQGNGPSIDNITAQPSTCEGNNGSVLINVSNGTPPLTYSLDNQVQLHGFFDNLTSGTYTLTIVDATGCFVEDSVVIESTSAASIISVETKNTTCGEANGTLTVHVDNVEGILFSIDGINFQPDPYFNNLSAQSYAVITEDSNGCTDTEIVTITENELPQIETLNVTASHCNKSDGVISVHATGGAPPYRFSIDGINFNGANEFTSLSPGHYVVHVIDANGCTSKIEATVGQLTGPSINRLSIIPAECDKNNGSIQIEIEGGLEPIEMKLDNELIQAGSLLNLLGAG